MKHFKRQKSALTKADKDHDPIPCICGTETDPAVVMPATVLNRRGLCCGAWQVQAACQPTPFAHLSTLPNKAAMPVPPCRSFVLVYSLSRLISSP